MAVKVLMKGQRKRQLVTQNNRVPPGRDPTAGASRLVQEYGLAGRAAELVYGRQQDHPEGDSRYEHWREVMAIVQKTRRREMERRHLLR